MSPNLYKHPFLQKYAYMYFDESQFQAQGNHKNPNIDRNSYTQIIKTGNYRSANSIPWKPKPPCLRLVWFIKNRTKIFD